MNDNRTFRILIAGGGTAGWMAAALLARFLPPDYRVELVESEAIGTVGVGEATIPQIRHFNQALGIDEAEFLRETKGSFKLGIAFDGWRGEGHSYMHAFGPVGQSSGLIAFRHYWLRAKALGHAKDLAHYSPNEMAARNLRMPGPGSADLPYAYHFDASLYAAFLRHYAETRGVVRAEGIIERVERDSETGDIAALVLDGDRRLEADFFIDCTGFRALLIEHELDAGFTDWSHWLPCDRAVAVPCSAHGDFTPYTRATAHDAGWQWRIPLQHRVGNGIVYCSEFLSDDDAQARLLANLDGKPMADPNRLRFTTGMRTRQWSHNCLALGLAAGFMEPLESTSIHLIQSSIARFLAMLPGREPAPAMVAEFNRQSHFEWSRIRDFLILHYRANGREGEPFWDRCRDMDLPDTLSAKIEQFRNSGFIHREHEELFTQDGWLQVFVGQGVIPGAHHPLADAMPMGEVVAMLARIDGRIGTLIEAMPDHAQFLRAYCMPRSEAAARKRTPA